MKGQLSTKDWELLSSYLDGELNPRDKARVEARLNSQPEYKEALDGLKRTQSILKRAPVRKVPRNFTLTAADVQVVRTPRWIPTMQWSSAAAALVAVFLFAYQLVPGFSGALTTASQKSVDSEMGAAEMAAPMAADSSLAATPEIIYWGGPPAPGITAQGLGGMGGGDGGSGIAAAPTPTPFPQPPIPNMLPNLQPQATEVARSAVKEPVTGTGPILGVKPEDEQGRQLAASTVADAQGAESESIPVRQPQPVLIVAGALLLLAAGLMATAILLKRKLH